MWRSVERNSTSARAKDGVCHDVGARFIHDLSCPHGKATNDVSDPMDLLPLSYESVDTLARRVEHLRTQYFQWLSVSILAMPSLIFATFSPTPACVPSLGAHLTVAVVLALTFGWTGSPNHYNVFGGTITLLVRRESPDLFFWYTWVDNHGQVKADQHGRLELSEGTLVLPCPPS
ncbi:Hypothetical protein PHPALM_14620 [Phytophthora palmivora]|uniref:Uncharacterized protein n=1 Tax=Phytophthora palmivora TaxID=4796 RepID=A0A2P4XU91_9STRA|nr:Hypothetical protein PHPALM_14620 [Phytophthora palmivora]